MTQIRGIDISHWQGNPDFARMKAAGVQYVIIKATEGVSYTDPAFHANIRGAAAAGLPVGAYHFLRSTPIDRQCQDFLAAVKPYKPALLAIDAENPPGNTELSNLGKAAITDRVITIYKAIRAAGYACPVYVYSSKSWFGTYIDTARCKAAGLLIWLAWYTNATPDNTDRSGICDMWQYASDGHVDGISGNVDCNVSYQGLEAPATAVQIDTTMDVSRRPGEVYTFRTNSNQAPSVSVGTPGVVELMHCRREMDADFWHLFFTGKPGTEAGIYTAAPGEKPLKRFVAKVI